MEQHEGPQTPFEVYCHHCRVTFAAGTPRCIHCGGRLGRSGKRGEPQLALQLPEGEVAEPGLARRLGGVSLWVLVAIGAALSRMCAEG